MFKLNCKIEIKSETTGATVLFRRVGGVSVRSSMSNFTDTCTVTLPRIYSKKGTDEPDITKIFKRNDKISVELGYDDNLETVFKGYLKSVSTTVPVVLECENEAWLLKQKKLTAQHYPKLKLKDFVDEHMSEFEFEKEIVDVELGEVRINGDTTLAKVFDYFMSNYPFRFFFRDGVFYGVMGSSLLLRNDAVKTHKFKFGTNIIGDNLTYTLEDDINIQIVAKAILKDNKKIECKEPEMCDGEVRTFLVPGATTEAELKAFAVEKLKTFKCDKMDGDFTAFGVPLVKKGDVVHLYDDDEKTGFNGINPFVRAERNDKKFIVESVNYCFGMNGYRQKVGLGYEIKKI